MPMMDLTIRYAGSMLKGMWRMLNIAVNNMIIMKAAASLEKLTPRKTDMLVAARPSSSGSM